MIKVVAKGVYLEGKTDEAIALYDEMVKETRNEQGCIAYNLFRDKDNKDILTMIEEWESVEALEAHKNSEHFTRIIPKIARLRKSAELNVYELIY
ncbi:putative quinol monooxygenase [Sedimentibacter saalensis]|uniref:Quinol monooxygenase YgiN n=1 Tax=Sedimentibacter saalensis TaxID=130788 RepID=A0A562JKT3_9FIRM|nr:putative quinol monooxygenase [Sedimentibacter saalensis]TWH83831.1 quinol monooxygenase YgiN [Sedimentibacter saalensis]